MIFGMIHGCIHAFRDWTYYMFLACWIIHWYHRLLLILECEEMMPWRRILSFCNLGQQLPIQPIHGSSGSIEANCNRPESNLGLLWGLTIGTGYIPRLSFKPQGCHYCIHVYPGQGGSILFVLLSKVTILMKPLVNKSWYTELVLYLICLAMGTMLAAISFQLIPEGKIVAYACQMR